MRQLVCVASLALLPSLAVAQEKTVPVPAGLKVEGVPAVPQSVAEAYARYAQYRDARLQAWNPAKRQILISTAMGSAPQLYLVDGPGRDRHQLTWFSGAGVSPLQSAAQFDPADGNSFVFMLDPEGGESRSIYRGDLATGQVKLAVPSKSRYDPAWSRQGKWLAYDSVERNGADRDLYVVQPADPATTKRRLTDAGNFSAHDWSPDGNTIVANEFVSNQESYPVLIDVRKGEKKYLTPRDGEKTQWFQLRFSPDGKKVYGVSDRGGEFQRLWRYDIATSTWSAVTAATDNVDVLGGYGISPEGAQLAIVFDRGAGSELQVIDLATMKQRSLPALTRALYTGVQWRPGSKELGFTMGSIKALGDAYSIDTSIGTLTRWTFSETTFNTDVLPSPEIVEWKSSDGVAITGVLYRPPAKFKGRSPVFVNIHGGPEFVEKPRFLGFSNYFLNELGIAVLYPNVRGSTGFGKKFQDMDNGKGREGAIKDIGAALDWIATRPELDSSKVLLAGGSYGGWLSLEAGIVYNDRVAGVITGAGITDFITFMEQQTPARLVSRRAEYGDERDPAMREFLKSISPITRASDLKKPTFIIQGGKDPRVPVSQAQDLVNALRANNAPVWYMEFVDANHDNLGAVAEQRNYMYETWILFVKQFLLNDRPVGTASR